MDDTQDPSLFRQKTNSTMRKGMGEQAITSNVSSRSGFAAPVAPPVWKMFVTNKRFQEDNSSAISAERSMLSRGNKEPRLEVGEGVLRMGDLERDAEELLGDPEFGGAAEESLWKRDLRGEMNRAQELALRKQDPSRVRLSESERKAAEGELSMSEIAPERRAELKAMVEKDNAYQMEDKELYDTRMRAMKLKQGGVGYWKSLREGAVDPAEKQAEQVRAAEAGRKEMDAVEQSAIAEEKEILRKMADGVRGNELANLQGRMAELQAAKDQIAMAKGQKLEEVQAARVKAAEEAEKPFFDAGDTIGGIWDAVKGLGVTAPAAFYQLVEGMERPDEYSESAKRAFAEADAYTQEMQVKTEARKQLGESSSVGESFREAGPSLGFSLGSMAAALPAMKAGAVVGAKVGAGVAAAAGLAGPQALAPEEVVTVPVGAGIGGLIGAGAAGMAASGGAAYRMAGASFLNESFQKMEQEALATTGRNMTEEEKAAAYEALLPIAKNSALWEAGPEAVATAITAGAGKLIFGKSIVATLEKWGVKPAVAAAVGAKTAVKAGVKAGGAVGAVAGELATETLTQVEQNADNKKVEALAAGESMEGIKADWTAGGLAEAFKEVAPQTLAMMAMMGGGATAVKGALTGYDIITGKKKGTDKEAELAQKKLNAAVAALDPNAEPPSMEEAGRASLGARQEDGMAGIAKALLIERKLVGMEKPAADRADAAKKMLEEAEALGDPVAIGTAKVEFLKARDEAVAAPRVRGVLKITRGRELSDLKPAEAQALGITRDGKQMEGEELAAVGLTKPLVEFEDGFPIVTDEALSMIERVLPEARAEIKMDQEGAMLKAKERAVKAKAGAGQMFRVTGTGGTVLEVEAKDEAGAEMVAMSDPAWSGGETIDSILNVTPTPSVASVAAETPAPALEGEAGAVPETPSVIAGNTSAEPVAKAAEMQQVAPLAGEVAPTAAMGATPAPAPLSQPGVPTPSTPAGVENQAPMGAPASAGVNSPAPTGQPTAPLPAGPAPTPGGVGGAAVSRDRFSQEDESTEAKVHRAILSYEGADQRWEEVRQKGATDEELKEIIGREFGVRGGSSMHGGFDVWGGPDPRIMTHGDRKVIKGKELVNFVRNLIGVPVVSQNTPAAAQQATSTNKPSQQAPSRIKKAITKAKKELGDALKITNNPDVRIRAFEDGTVVVNIAVMEAEAANLGMDEAGASRWIAAAIDEEVRHAAQHRAARATWEALGGVGVYEEWRDAHYKKIWENEFTPEQRKITRDLYGKKLESLEPWQQAFEGLRIIQQKMATGSPTEVAALWASLKPEIIAHIRAALKALKKMLKGDLSPTLKAEIAAIEKQLIAYDRSNKPRTGSAKDSSQKPAASSASPGDSKLPQGNSSGKAASTGEAVTPPSDGVGSQPVANEKVTFVRDGVERVGEVKLVAPNGDLLVWVDGKQLRVLAGEVVAAPQVQGVKINEEWSAFAKESGTIGIPRGMMPQIHAGDRSALVQFLKARGINYGEETVPAASLKPTQAEFSPEKVQKAKDYEGGNRSILVSADNHVLDGHHQWMAALENGENIDIIRLDAPIRKLLPLALKMPSVENSGDEILEIPEESAPTPSPRDRNQFPGEDYAVPPNVVYIQPRGLNTEPMSDQVFTYEYDGTAESAARVGAKAFVELQKQFPDMSQRESIFGASGADGMTVFRLQMDELNDKVTVLGKDGKKLPAASTNQDAKEVAAKKPALTEAEQALKDAFKGMVDGLDAADFTPNYTQGIPPEKIGQFVAAAQKLIADGVTTPEGLAAALDKISPKLRTYSEAVWSAFRMVDPSLQNSTNWAEVYGENAEEKNVEMTQEQMVANAITRQMGKKVEVVKKGEDFEVVGGNNLRYGIFKNEGLSNVDLMNGIPYGDDHMLLRLQPQKEPTKQTLLADFVGQYLAAPQSTKNKVDMPQRIGKLAISQKDTKAVMDMVFAAGQKSPDGKILISGTEHHKVWLELKDILAYNQRHNIDSGGEASTSIKGDVEIAAEIAERAEPVVEVKAPAAETKAAKATVKKPDTSTKKLKTQKEYLLAALDKAFAEAEDTPLTQEQLDAIREIDDNWVEDPVYAGKERAEEARAMRAKAIEIFNSPAIPKIEIEVPGDGTFRIVNTKSAIAEFREKAKKKFPTSDPKANEPKSGATSPTAITPIGKPKEVGDFQKIASLATTKDETRYILKAIHNDGEHIVSTDGRRLLVITRKTIGSVEKPINLDPKTNKPLKGKDGDSDFQYPNWQQIIPKDFGEEIPIDTAVIQKLVIQAAEMKGDKLYSVSFWRDASGRLGATAQYPDFGMFAGGEIDPDTAKFLGAYNVDFFNDGLTIMRRLGFDKVTMQYTDAESPLTMVAPDVKYILMPMRGDSASYHPLSKAAEEAEAARQAELERAAEEREKMKAEREAKEAERIAKIVGDKEQEVEAKVSEATPETPTPTPEAPRAPRIIMGKGTIGAFDGFSHGDVFQDTSDNRWVLAGGNGWTLYPEGETNKPDYTKSPHPLVVNIKEGNELRDVFRKMKEEAETPAAPAKSPSPKSKPTVAQAGEAIKRAYPYKTVQTASEERKFIAKAKANLVALGLKGWQVDSAIESAKTEKARNAGGKIVFMNGGHIMRELLKSGDIVKEEATAAPVEEKTATTSPAGNRVEKQGSKKEWKVTNGKTMESVMIYQKGDGFTAQSPGSAASGSGIAFDSAVAWADNFLKAVSKAKPAKPRKTKGPSPLDLLENYFRPGKIVEGYGGKDKVISFDRGEDQQWSVTVQAVDDADGRGPRSHSTMPSNKVLIEAWKERGAEQEKPAPKPKSIFQSAQDNWPEDEAAQVLSMWKEADFTNEEILAAVEKDREHFKKVFSSEDDAAELMERFNAAIDKGLADMGVDQAQTTPQDAADSAKPPQTDRIEDFGEKIYGAKKDLWGKFKRAIEQDLPDDVADMAISKSFPEPDYEVAIAQGISSDSLATYKAIRDAIPSKPRVGYKLDRWASMFRGIHPLMQKLVTGAELSRAEIDAIEKLLRTGALGKKIAFYKELGFPAFQKADDWNIFDGVTTFFEKGVKLEKPIIKTVASFKGRFTDIDSAKLGEEGRIEVLDGIRAKIISEMDKPADSKAKSIPFSIYSDRLTKDVFIGKKAVNGVIRMKTGFSNAKFARTYLEDNQAQLEEQWKGMGAKPDYRRQVNAPRQGPTRREGDVTPQMFQDAFGFRGVQFGNWVEGDRRQVDINEAFDAFMDLAEALGIPPRAVSLDGSLGLAFGARGHAGAAAHYEPGEVVINLTKMSGPGSLAHEWFHAFDNYFARLDRTGETKAKSLDLFATSNKSTPKHMRPEVWEAFKNIRAVLATGPFAERSKSLDDTKSKPYYQTTIEKAARAFERYTVDRLAGEEISNDYLVNIVKDFDPALPTEEEMKAGIREAFDKLFGVIEAKITDRRTALEASPLQYENLSSYTYRRDTSRGEVRHIVDTYNERTGKPEKRVFDTYAEAKEEMDRLDDLQQPGDVNDFFKPGWLGAAELGGRDGELRKTINFRRM